MMAADDTSTTPAISIGVPVYNGERFIGEALSSLMSQTFTDFELIISDNASTDRTREICEKAAAQDPRISYIRQPENLGAAPNFNVLLDHATAPLFKWAAADDLHDPTYLEKCIHHLRLNPDAVLCHSETLRIDESGALIERRTPDRDQEAEDPVVRFRSLVRMGPCHAIFGVIRTDVLKSTRRIQGMSHGDGVLLLELGTRGPFAFVPAPLFLSRVHPEQSAVRLSANRSAYAEWFDRRNAGKSNFPYWRMCRAFVEVAASSPADIRTRARCILSALGYAATKRRLLWSEVKQAVLHLSARTGLYPRPHS